MENPYIELEPLCAVSQNVQRVYVESLSINPVAVRISVHLDRKPMELKGVKGGLMALPLIIMNMLKLRSIINQKLTIKNKPITSMRVNINKRLIKNRNPIKAINIIITNKLMKLKKMMNECYLKKIEIFSHLVMNYLRQINKYYRIIAIFI